MNRSNHWSSNIGSVVGPPRRSGDRNVGGVVHRGKGTEDLGVHFFERLTGATISERDWQSAQHMEVKLPLTPLSYEGRLLKIRWSIRVRAFLDDGTELIAQQPFYLGSLTREI